MGVVMLQGQKRQTAFCRQFTGHMAALVERVQVAGHKCGPDLQKPLQPHK